MKCKYRHTLRKTSVTIKYSVNRKINAIKIYNKMIKLNELITNTFP